MLCVHLYTHDTDIDFDKKNGHTIILVKLTAFTNKRIHWLKFNTLIKYVI